MNRIHCCSVTHRTTWCVCVCGGGFFFFFVFRAFGHVSGVFWGFFFPSVQLSAHPRNIFLVPFDIADYNILSPCECFQNVFILYTRRMPCDHLC